MVSLGFTACNLNSKISKRLIEWQYRLKMFDVLLIIITVYLIRIDIDSDLSIWKGFLSPCYKSWRTDWSQTQETYWLVTLFVRRHLRLSIEKQCSIRNVSKDWGRVIHICWLSMSFSLTLHVHRQPTPVYEKKYYLTIRFKLGLSLFNCLGFKSWIFCSNDSVQTMRDTVLKMI